MHPILAEPRRLLGYLVARLLVGAGVAGLLVASGVAPWPPALVFALPVCVVFGFLAPSAYYVCRSLPLARRRTARVVVVFGAASIVAGLAGLALGETWNALVRTLAADWSIAVTPALAVVLGAASAVAYLLSLLAHDVLIGIENLREAEQRDAQSRLLARDAELQLLRAQINPHFLFNSLNSISALTASDARAARAMTIELAQFFRQTLALSQRQKIALADEMALCESFLAVEKIRFGARLDARIDVADDARGGLVPPMLLQPLVENALKHGIRDLVDGGAVVVRSFVREDWLHALVENTVGAGGGAVEGQGVGLRNLRQRLANLYGERARITWQRDDDAFRVEITLPFECAEPKGTA
jgi:LytS/YehU family sensor histidine kinase